MKLGTLAQDRITQVFDRGIGSFREEFISWKQNLRRSKRLAEDWEAAVNETFDALLVDAQSAFRAWMDSELPKMPAEAVTQLCDRMETCFTGGDGPRYSIEPPLKDEQRGDSLSHTHWAPFSAKSTAQEIRTAAGQEIQAILARTLDFPPDFPGATNLDVYACLEDLIFQSLFSRLHTLSQNDDLPYIEALCRLFARFNGASFSFVSVELLQTFLEETVQQVHCLGFPQSGDIELIELCKVIVKGASGNKLTELKDFLKSDETAPDDQDPDDQDPDDQDPIEMGTYDEQDPVATAPNEQDPVATAPHEQDPDDQDPIEMGTYDEQDPVAMAPSAGEDGPYASLAKEARALLEESPELRARALLPPGRSFLISLMGTLVRQIEDFIANPSSYQVAQARTLMEIYAFLIRIHDTRDYGKTNDRLVRRDSMKLEDFTREFVLTLLTAGVQSGGRSEILKSAQATEDRASEVIASLKKSLEELTFGGTTMRVRLGTLTQTLELLREERAGCKASLPSFNTSSPVGGTPQEALERLSATLAIKRDDLQREAATLSSLLEARKYTEIALPSSLVDALSREIAQLEQELAQLRTHLDGLTRLETYDIRISSLEEDRGVLLHDLEAQEKLISALGDQLRLLEGQVDSFRLRIHEATRNLLAQLPTLPVNPVARS